MMPLTFSITWQKITGKGMENVVEMSGKVLEFPLPLPPKIVATLYCV